MLIILLLIALHLSLSPLRAMELQNERDQQLIRAQAHYELGLMAMRGQAGHIDYAQARTYFERALESGDPKLRACSKLFLAKISFEENNMRFTSLEAREHLLDAFRGAWQLSDASLQKFAEQLHDLLSQYAWLAQQEFSALLIVCGMLTKPDGLQNGANSLSPALTQILQDSDPDILKELLKREEKRALLKEAHRYYAEKNYNKGRDLVNRPNPDYHAARICYLKASENRKFPQIVSLASLELALLYYFGKGIERNFEHALSFSNSVLATAEQLPEFKPLCKLATLIIETFDEQLPLVHLACMAGDSERIEECRQQHQGLEVRDRNGKTGLYKLLLSNNHEAIARCMQNEWIHEAHIRILRPWLPVFTDNRIKAYKEFEIIKAIAYAREQRMLEFLLEQGFSVDAQDRFGVTPLMQAVRDNREDVVELLLRYNPNLRLCGVYQGTPLHTAVWNQNASIVDRLIAAQANVNAYNLKSETPLLLALLVRNRRLIEQLTALSDLSLGECDGMPPLHLAVELADYESIENLIRNGAHVNQRSYYGPTPLHIALVRKDARAVSLLLKHGADVQLCYTPDGDRIYYSRDIRSKTPLVLALFSYEPAIAQIIKQLRLSYFRMTYSYFTKMLSSLPCWIYEDSYNEYTGEPFYENSDNPLENHLNTLVLFLLQENRISQNSDLEKLVAYLVTCICKPNKRGENDTTLLHWCAGGGTEMIAQALISSGASASKKDNAGMTPLHYAVRRRTPAMAQLLMNNDQEMIYEKDVNGDTPLHLAVENQIAAAMIEVLVEGCERAITDKLGNTPLQKAILLRKHELVDLFDGHGLDVAARDSEGKTLLHYAVIAECPEIIRNLLRRGANRNTADNHGVTPLALAADTNDEIRNIFNE